MVASFQIAIDSSVIRLESRGSQVRRYPAPDDAWGRSEAAETVALMLSQGIHPKVVQERLGHSTIGVTLDVYSHVLPDMQREAAATLDHIFRAG